MSIRVEFLQGFRGVETNEIHYKKGDIVEVPDEWIERLVADKRVKVLAAEVNATDSAIKLAEEHGIDIAEIQGSGVGGRVLKSDIEAVINDQS